MKYLLIELIASSWILLSEEWELLLFFFVNSDIQQESTKNGYIHMDRIPPAISQPTKFKKNAKETKESNIFETVGKKCLKERNFEAKRSARSST